MFNIGIRVRNCTLSEASIFVFVMGFKPMKPHAQKTNLKGFFGTCRTYKLLCTPLGYDIKKQCLKCEIRAYPAISRSPQSLKLTRHYFFTVSINDNTLLSPHGYSKQHYLAEPQLFKLWSLHHDTVDIIRTSRAAYDFAHMTFSTIQPS